MNTKPTFNDMFARLRALAHMTDAEFQGFDAEYDEREVEISSVAQNITWLHPSMRSVVEEYVRTAIGWVVCPYCGGRGGFSGLDHAGVMQDADCLVCEEHPGSFLPQELVDELEREDRRQAEEEAFYAACPF